jgi:hypothetical protein
MIQGADDRDRSVLGGCQQPQIDLAVRKLPRLDASDLAAEVCSKPAGEVLIARHRQQKQGRHGSSILTMSGLADAYSSA